MSDFEKEHDLAVQRISTVIILVLGSVAALALALAVFLCAGAWVLLVG